MILILILVLVLLLKLADIWLFASLSWWWISGGAFFIFLWFEFFERMFGLDKRKDQMHYQKMRDERIKRGLAKKKSHH